MNFPKGRIFWSYDSWPFVERAADRDKKNTNYIVVDVAWVWKSAAVATAAAACMNAVECVCVYVCESGSECVCENRLRIPFPFNFFIKKEIILFLCFYGLMVKRFNKDESQRASEWVRAKARVQMLLKIKFFAQKFYGSRRSFFSLPSFLPPAASSSSSSTSLLAASHPPRHFCISNILALSFA